MDAAHATYHNGRLELNQQVDWPDGTTAEVIPIPPGPANGVGGVHSGWPQGYFEQTSGALSDEEFERPSQGGLPHRDDW